MDQKDAKIKMEDQRREDGIYVLYVNRKEEKTETLLTVEFSC